MLSAELQALVDDLAEELTAPAVIEDYELRILAYSSHDMPVDDLRRESILRRHAPPAQADWFRRRYRIDTAVRPLRIPADASRGILGRLCVPIRHRGQLCGYLWLIDDPATLADAQVGLAMRAAERAGVLMFDELLAERLASVALGRLLSPSEELRADTARYFDGGLLGPPGQLTAVVVQAAATSAAAAQPVIAESLTDTTRRQPAGAVIGRAAADHGVLVLRERGRGGAAGLELASAASRDLLRRLRHEDRAAAVVAGIGDPAGMLADVYQSYLQARLAARVAATVSVMGPVARWSDLGVFRTLAQLPVGANALASLDPRLSRLLGQADSQVLTTLETYLDFAGDKRASAERLHLHRGTVYYRLRKAEQVAGIDLRSGHDRLAIHLGFKLARLAGAYPERTEQGQDVVADGRGADLHSAARLLTL